MAYLGIDVSGVEKLQQAMKDFQGNTERTINEVLHNEASPLIQEAIKRLIPTSGKTWSGKKPPAKTGKSLTDVQGNLSITVTTTRNYQYLYFPDNGTNTRRHVGNQQFFRRGAEEKQDEIIERCVAKLVNNFET